MYTTQAGLESVILLPQPLESHPSLFWVYACCAGWSAAPFPLGKMPDLLFLSSLNVGDPVQALSHAFIGVCKYTVQEPICLLGGGISLSPSPLPALSCSPSYYFLQTSYMFLLKPWSHPFLQEDLVSCSTVVQKHHPGPQGYPFLLDSHCVVVEVEVSFQRQSREIIQKGNMLRSALVREP